MVLSTALFTLENALIVLLLDRSRGVTEVAFYRVVLPLAALNNVVMNAFSWLYVPSASRLVAREDHSGIDHLYWRTAAWISVLTFPVFAITFCFAGTLTTYLYGERYAQSGAVLALLALASYSNVALGFNGVTLKVLGKIRYVLTSNLSSALIKIVLCLLLIPRFGALGAAASVVVGMVAYNILMQWGLHRVAHVRMLGREYLPLAVLILVSIFSLFSLREVVSHNIYLAILLTATATAILMLAAKHRLNIATTFPEALRVPVLGRLLA